MAEKLRELGDFKGRVILRLNFRLKGYILRNIYGPLDGKMVILQLCCWNFSHKETLLFIRLKLNFIQKKQN